MTPTPRVKMLTAWSYSRKQTYDRCPLLAKLKFIDKLKEPKNDAMQRGSDIHTIAENYVLGAKGRVPKELKLFAEEFKDLRTKLCVVEEQWAFDKDWKITSWFGSEAFCRMVLDVTYDEALDKGLRFVVIDHKTGKIREENREQLELYAIGGFARNENVTEVVAKFWYIDEGEEVVVTFYRKDFEKLKKKWAKKIKAMMNDKIFPPRPGNHCRWCYFKAGKAGLCKY